MKMPPKIPEEERVAQKKLADARWKSLQAQLEEVGAMQAELKRRAMVFQCDAKERVAAHYKKPRWFYYHYSYDDWVKVWHKYLKEKKVYGYC